MSDPPVGVLIVDDQAPFRRAAAAVVRLTPGFTAVGEAESGEAALQMVASLHPALVLMDINMPGLNGIETTRRITTSHPDVVVLLLSTYQAEDLPADAGSSGYAAYINKDEFGPSVLRDLWDAQQGAGRA
jgi:two-component system invasion response regulator UvrY